MFRNVGIQQSDAGEIPKRKHTRFKTRQKFEIETDKGFFHKEDGGIVLSKMLVLVYQNVQLHTPAETVFIKSIFRSQYEYFKGKSV